MEQIIQSFYKYLSNLNISDNTLKFYKSDIRNFINWLIQEARLIGTNANNLQDAIPLITTNTANKYKNFLINSKIPVKTINRRFTSIRYFSRFLQENNILDFDFSKNLDNISEIKPQSPFTPSLLLFKSYLSVNKASELTIKNYLADIGQFLTWIEKLGKNSLKDITSKDIKRYLLIHFSEASEATVERKTSSLKKFFTWVKDNNLITFNPVIKYLKDIQFIKPISDSIHELQDRNINRKVFGKKPNNEPIRRIFNAFLAERPKLQKLIYKLLYTRPKWYIAYHTLSISRYINLAVLIIFASGLGFGIYQQFFAKTPSPLAFPTSPTRPNRFLSFQGRLTDEFNTPITVATDITFKLWDHATNATEVDCDGGVDEDCLWSSGAIACSITPDQDGIFNTLLGSDCGTELTSDIFSENADVWLGINVEGETMTDRIQIATVAYALNSETLQGYPLTATASSPVTTANSILAMDAGGQVVLAEVAPTLKSVSGTFAIQGESVNIQGIGGPLANGDIDLTPASTGTVSVIASGDNEDSFYITNANTTSGALIHGYYGGSATDVNLLKLGVGATEATKFFVQSNGTAFISDALGVGITAPTQSIHTTGSIYVEGAYYDSSGDPGGLGQVLSSTVSGTDWVDPSGGIAGTGTSNYIPVWSASDSLTDSNIYYDSGNIGIGTTVPTKGKLNILGSLAVGSTAYTEVAGAAPSNGLIVEGNVGIGVTAPAYKLDVAGDIQIANGSEFYSYGSATLGDRTYSQNNYVSSGQTFTASIDALDIAVNSLSAGGITGTGTSNYIPIWSSSSSLANSQIYDDGTGVGIGTTVPTKGKLNILGSLAVGSTAYTEVAGAAPTNGLIVEGSVGIGTTSPTVKLDVNGGIAATGATLGSDTGVAKLTSGVLGYIAGTDNYVPKWSSSFLTTTSSIYDDGTGVGIGITNPFATFSVGSSGVNRFTVAGASGNTAIEGTLSDITDTTLIIDDDIQINGSGLIKDSGSNNRIGIGATTTLTNVNTVLSGTTILTASSLATFTTAASLAMSSTTSLTLGGNSTIIGGTAADSSLTLQSTSGSGTTDYIKFAVGNAGGIEAARITTSGNIGAGTTSPQTKLGIVGGVGIGTTDDFANAAIAANNLAVQGNIGVGTTSPPVFNSNNRFPSGNRCIQRYF